MIKNLVSTPVCDPKNIFTLDLEIEEPETIFPITGARDTKDPAAKVFLMNEKNNWYKVVLHSNGMPDVFTHQLGNDPKKEHPMTQEQFESFLKKFKDNVQLRKGEKVPNYDEIADRFDRQHRTNIASWERSATAGMTLLEATRT